MFGTVSVTTKMTQSTENIVNRQKKTNGHLVSLVGIVQQETESCDFVFTNFINIESIDAEIMLNSNEISVCFHFQNYFDK